MQYIPPSARPEDWRSHLQRHAEAARRDLSMEELGKVTDSTRVIISFGTRKGGFELTNQLRQDIMRRYGRAELRNVPGRGMLLVESDPSFCYLDAVTLDGTPGASWKRSRVQVQGGRESEQVTIDEWQSRNDFWFRYYPAAMANSRVMIILVTKPWMDSQYCIQEFAWYTVQSLRDNAVRTPCLFLVWPEASAAFAMLLHHMKSALQLAAPSESPFVQSVREYELMRKVFKEQLSVLEGPELERRRGAAVLLLDRMRHSVLHVPQSAAPGKAQATYYYNSEGGFVRRAEAARQYEHTFEFNYAFDAAFTAEFFRRLDAALEPAGIKPR